MVSVTQEQRSADLDVHLGTSKGCAVVDVDDLKRMRRAFAGVHVPTKNGKFKKIRFENGQAFFTDGHRLHSVKVDYFEPIGIDIPYAWVRDCWASEVPLEIDLTTGSDSMVSWADLVPKTDVGTLCDLEVWLPVLNTIRGWGWSKFSYHHHEMVVRPMSSRSPRMVATLSYLMYKGKKLGRLEERVLNPQYIYDVFENARRLGDDRVFLCLVSHHKKAPVLCRGNSSGFSALVLTKK